MSGAGIAGRLIAEEEVLQAFRAGGYAGLIDLAAPRIRSKTAAEMMEDERATLTNLIAFPQRPRSGKPAGRRGRVLKFKRPKRRALAHGCAGEDGAA